MRSVPPRGSRWVSHRRLRIGMSDRTTIGNGCAPTRYREVVLTSYNCEAHYSAAWSFNFNLPRAEPFSFTPSFSLELCLVFSISTYQELNLSHSPQASAWGSRGHSWPSKPFQRF